MAGLSLFPSPLNNALDFPIDDESGPVNRDVSYTPYMGKDFEPPAHGDPWVCRTSQCVVNPEAFFISVVYT